MIRSVPDGITACLFDLDGVLTKTAKLHSAAWKTMFDEYLQRRSGPLPAPFVPFGPIDYQMYVDGKPRLDGVRSFLASRGIDLPEGTADDPEGTETVHGLGARKNALVLRLIREQGVEVYEGSVRFVNRLRHAGLRLAVVTSSKNADEILAAAGIASLFEVQVDGLVAEREQLRGKPAPDTFLAAARALRAGPAQAAVFEDAQAGVEAGRAGGFGWVVGVDRAGQAEALRQRGADIVVQDLAELM